MYGEARSTPKLTVGLLTSRLDRFAFARSSHVGVSENDRPVGSEVAGASGSDRVSSARADRVDTTMHAHASAVPTRLAVRRVLVLQPPMIVLPRIEGDHARS